MSEFLNLIKQRRSIRVVTDGAAIGDDALQALLKDALNNLPTAFNIQNTRMVLLLGAAHKAFWDDIVRETLRPKVKPENFGRTEKKLAGFAGGRGTVLFFIDQAPADKMKADMPNYADNVDPWQLQHAGMLQISVWLLLREAGYGASLQHYNPLVDDAVKTRWHLPAQWTLLAQMPFGIDAEQPGDKDFVPIDERFRLFDK